MQGKQVLQLYNMTVTMWVDVFHCLLHIPDKCDASDRSCKGCPHLTSKAKFGTALRLFGSDSRDLRKDLLYIRF